MSRWRSLLFVPADDEHRLARAHERGADAIILDLEDSVADDAKSRARRTIAGSIARIAPLGADLVVRINGKWRDALADLEAAIHPGLTAVMVPKVEDAARIAVIAEIVGELEEERGLPPGAVGIVALIESPLGLAALPAIALQPRLIGLALGSEDFSLALGAPPSPASLDLPCRQIALAAAARSLMAIAIPYSIAAFRDIDASRDAAMLARSLGGTGALCVHPSQVEIANQVFAVSAEERAGAEAVLAAWAAAQERGLNVVKLDGGMIDRPVVERARRVLGLR